MNRPSSQAADWWDVELDYTLEAQQCYAIEWSDLATATLDIVSTNTLPVDVGPLTVESAGQTFLPNSELVLGRDPNGAVPRMRFEVVPEPSVYGLLVGLMFLLPAIRTRRAN